MRASLLTRAGSLAAAVAFIVGPLKKATQYVLVYEGNANFAPCHSRLVTARA